jgi:hypothetical protein
MNTFIVVDIEADGQVPGLFSMVSFAAVPIVNGKIHMFPMNQGPYQTENTPRRNFCVQDCTASWERNDVNVRFFPILGLHYYNSTSYKHRFRTNRMRKN